MDRPEGPTEAPFFVAGGTVPASAQSYVERSADRDLFDGLFGREYCFVLNARQMGKSSLSVRTILKLNAAGVRTVFIDLTRIGAHNVSAEQWYAGLLAETGRGLNLRREFLSHWKDHVDLSPVQRYFGAVREVALEQVPEPIVVFVDEIDAVRSLPFVADEFFAAVRACFNRRTEDPAFGRLTFCLVGSATPADLISDTRMSPFNIGRRVELQDFRPEEAALLTRGLQGGKAVLDRVLHWTGGQPYLTQRLCQAIAREPQVCTPRDVDRLCATLFLSKAARDSDDNLSFVRNRLLRSEVDLSTLLDLYLQVRAGKRVRDDETNPNCAVLRLSGVCRIDGDHLKVRNRIYDRVFDREWVETHLPDAELRRQRAAYRRGVLRTSAIAGVGLAALGIASGIALDRARRANTLSGALRRETKRTSELLYTSDMNLIQLLWDAKQAWQIPPLLKETENNPMRGWEWEFWRNRMYPSSRKTFPGYAMYMGDGASICSVTRDGTILIIDRVSGREIRRFDTGIPGIYQPDISPDGTRLARINDKGIAQVWDLGSGKVVFSLPKHRRPVRTVTFSPDGTMIATSCGDMDIFGELHLWDARDGKRRVDIATPTIIWGHGFSPDSKRITVHHSPAIEFDTTTGKKIAEYSHGSASPVPIFLGDRTVTLGNFEGFVWDWKKGKRIGVIPGARGTGIASPDGQWFLTGDRTGSLKIWDAKTLRITKIIDRFPRPLGSVGNPGSISKDGKRILARSIYDDSIEITLNIDKESHITGPISYPGSHGIGIFSDDGNSIYILSDTYITTYDSNSLKEFSRISIPKYSNTISSLINSTFFAISSLNNTDVFDRKSAKKIWSINERLVPSSEGHHQSNRYLLTQTKDFLVNVWDVPTRRRLVQLRGHQNTLQCNTVSPDGRLIATGARDGTAKIWDLRTGKLISTYNFSLEHWCNGLAFSKDSRYLFANGGIESSRISLKDFTTKSIYENYQPIITFPIQNDTRIFSQGLERQFKIRNTRTFEKYLGSDTPIPGYILDIDPSESKILLMGSNNSKDWNFYILNK